MLDVELEEVEEKSGRSVMGDIGGRNGRSVIGDIGGRSVLRRKKVIMRKKCTYVEEVEEV